MAEARGRRARGKDLRVAAQDQVRLRRVIAQGRERHAHAARRLLGMRREHPARLRLAPRRAVWLRIGRRGVLNQEGVVACEDEGAEAELLQAVPGVRELLQPALERREPRVGLSRLVDLAAVDHHQARPSHLAREGLLRRVAHRREIEQDGGRPRGAGAEAALPHGLEALLGPAHGELAGPESGESAAAVEAGLQLLRPRFSPRHPRGPCHRRQHVHAHRRDRRQLGQTRSQAHLGAVLRELVDELRGHLEAQGVDHEKNHLPAVRRQARVDHLVVEGALPATGRGQEAVQLAERGERLGQGVGPLAVAVAQCVGDFAQAGEVRQLLAEDAQA